MPQAVIGPILGGVASAGIGAIGSAISGNKAGAGAAQAQQALQQQRADLAPWRTTGGQALGASADLLGLNGPDAAAAAMGNFQTSPGYQWSMDQGTRAVDAGAAARGMLRSGAEIKAQQTFGTGLADQEFQQYYKNLTGLSTLGENAAAGGATTAQTAGSLAQGAGNTQGSIYGNQFGALGSTVNGLFQNPAVNNWLIGGGGGAPNYMAGTTNLAGTSPGYGDQLFNPGGVF
jgi:hypothetical protein